MSAADVGRSRKDLATAGGRSRHAPMRHSIVRPSFSMPRQGKPCRLDPAIRCESHGPAEGKFEYPRFGGARGRISGAVRQLRIGTRVSVDCRRSTDPTGVISEWAVRAQDSVSRFLALRSVFLGEPPR